MPTLTQQQMDNLQDELDANDISGFYLAPAVVRRQLSA